MAEIADDMLELERAVQLEYAAGDLAGAEQIYELISDGSDRKTHARAGALFRLANLYARLDRNADAKKRFLQLLRDFPQATDLIPIAELELTKVTALDTRDQMGTHVASMKHFGDLAIALLGALKNHEKERSIELLGRLRAGLDGLGSGSDAPEVLLALRTNVLEITATLLAERGGGMAAARNQMVESKNFEPLLKRGFPSDPHDLFAPVWRMKDLLAGTLADNDQKRSEEYATRLERYLAPMAALPTGQREATLARITTFAIRDIRASVREGHFAEARKRLDEFDIERYEQFSDDRFPVPNLLMGTPDQVVAAAWVVLYRAEQAGRELGRNPGVAEDHVSEAIKVCQDALPRVDDKDVAQLFQKQQNALEKALWEMKNYRPTDALRALRAVSQKGK